DPDDEADEEDDPDRILPRLALVVQGLLRKTLGLAEPLQEKGLHIHRRKGSERGISEERHDPGTGETSDPRVDRDADSDGDDRQVGDQGRDQHDAPPEVGRVHLVSDLRATRASADVSLTWASESTLTRRTSLTTSTG